MDHDRIYDAASDYCAAYHGAAAYPRARAILDARADRLRVVIANAIGRRDPDPRPDPGSMRDLPGGTDDLGALLARYAAAHRAYRDARRALLAATDNGPD